MFPAGPMAPCCTDTDDTNQSTDIIPFVCFIVVNMVGSTEIEFNFYVDYNSILSHLLSWLAWQSRFPIFAWRTLYQYIKDGEKKKDKGYWQN